jgi:hypothetical protein
LQPREHVACTNPIASSEHLVRAWLGRLLHHSGVNYNFVWLSSLADSFMMNM